MNCSTAALNDPGTSLDDVESLVGREPTLAQKLLKFINSSFCGLSQTVESIRRATALVGLRRLRTWVTLLAMGRMRHCPREIMVTANIRARMCENIACARRVPETDVFFIVGLLSVLDVLAGRPMPDILDELPLSDAVTAALLNYEGEAGETLKIVLAYEVGETTTIADSDVLPDQLTTSWMDAVHWADGLFADLSRLHA